jgi:hypothetical protein
MSPSIVTQLRPIPSSETAKPPERLMKVSISSDAGGEVGPRKDDGWPLFVLTLAHVAGRLWVTKVALSGLTGRHFTCFYAFLRQGAWSVDAVRQKVWEQCLALCCRGRVSAAS